jgi:hypothetical protein
MKCFLKLIRLSTDAICGLFWTLMIVGLALGVVFYSLIYGSVIGVTEFFKQKRWKEWRCE